jgi:hypothetical protein
MSKPRFLGNLINWENVGPNPGRTLLKMAIMVIAGVCLLAFLIPLGFKYHPFVVFYGACSFGATFFLVWLFGVVCAVASMIARLRKPESQRSPRLEKLGMLWNKFGLTCFFIWLVQLVIVAFILIKKGY